MTCSISYPTSIMLLILEIWMTYAFQPTYAALMKIYLQRTKKDSKYKDKNTYNMRNKGNHGSKYISSLHLPCKVVWECQAQHKGWLQWNNGDFPHFLGIRLMSHMELSKLYPLLALPTLLPKIYYFTSNLVTTHVTDIFTLKTLGKIAI